MPAVNFTDFYVLYQGHPKYRPGEIIEDEVIAVIVQKIEMMLFTNKGEVFGQPDFGADLLELLYQTKVSDQFVKNEIQEQISNYIVELFQTSYTIEVIFIQDPANFQDMMFINIKFSDYEIYAQIGGR
jgi:phage baseplate assembly protein W